MEELMFKHERNQFPMSLLGHLPEDAAIIAQDEMIKLGKEFIEDLPEKINRSRGIQRAYKKARNDTELIYLVFILGEYLAFSKLQIPPGLAGIIMGGQCDCDKCKKARGEDVNENDD